MKDYGSPKMSIEEQNQVMSDAYWELWGQEVQDRIDKDIEANRKADAEIELKNIAPGTKVKIEQLSHSFIFGSHIFNFDQLGTDERNERYKELFGTLFNSATIAFYQKQFELEEGKPRFEGEFRDSAEYWNNVPEPKQEVHWRRPATDPVVEFCESKGIRLHGHTLTWGNVKWQTPDWLMGKLPKEYLEQLPVLESNTSSKDIGKFFNNFTPSQIEAMLPEFTSELNNQMAKRIIDIALYYKDRIHSWDIVNESATDFGMGAMVPGDGICKSWYNLMPGDYTYRSFKIAESIFTDNVKLNINDYIMDERYKNQVNDLVDRGCKIDIVGAQMHLFDPQICADIAAGKPDSDLGEVRQSPDSVRKTMERLSETGKPLHLSEITITSPGDDLNGEAIQSIITRNLYRLWFSVKNMMGITWWNVVDDCGAPGEPSVSGLFKRDMTPKLAYYTLNDLINNEWKTKTTVECNSDGTVEFRGFRGQYKLSWIDKEGNECASVHEVN